MRLPRVRFTVRRMIVAVGVVALLIPFPLEALLLAIATLAMGFGVPALVVYACDEIAGHRAAIVASALIAACGGWYIIRPPLMATGPASWIASVLTALNLAGPLYLAVQLRRRGPLVAGEVLWAWVGLIWATIIVHHSANRSRSGFIISLDLMVQGTRLILVLSLLLALYGRRPERPGWPWAHYLGWGLAQCDVIAWGWDRRFHLF
jgi:hypothetical protein